MTTYGLRRFVETGTGQGDSLVYACTMPFSSLWSCEIERVILMYAADRVADDARVELFIGTSRQMLELLPRLPVDEPILFWLDAHFPGADSRLRAFDAEPDLTIRLPLADELSLIRQHRPRNADVISIDDARIWLDEPFEEVIADSLRDIFPAERGIGFIEAQFGATHRIEIQHSREGRIMLTPIPA